MTTIRRVAIVGAGAMGMLYASHFVRAGGFAVTLVARGRRARRLREAGLEVNGEPLRADVVDAGEAVADTPEADLVLVAVKHHDLAPALDDVASLVGDDTLFLSVLNGLDSEQAIAERFGAGKVLYCVALGMDAARDGNRIRFRNAGKLHFGAARNDAFDPRVERVQQALDRAGLAWETPVDMLRTVWWKFMVNVGVNQASAIMRAPYGDCRSDRHTRWLMDALMHEVVALSCRVGIGLTREDVERWHDVLAALPADGKTSMLQDVQAGRATEVEIFAGRVVALAREHGVASPVNETAYHVIRRLSDERGTRRT